MNILVTGGASGLGLAITHKLASDTSNFVNFTYCSSESSARVIEKSLPNSKAFHCDFSNEESVHKFIGNIDAMNLDGLVNNAVTGITKKHFHKIEPDEFLKSFSENVLSVIKISNRAIQTFRKKKFGRIVNILSTAIIDKPPIGWSEYAANKSYLLSLSNSWAAEYEKFNITSNCISPSFLLTDFHKDIDERIIEDIKSKSPGGVFLSTEDAAKAVSKLLASDSLVNGINMVINSAEDVI